MTINFNEIATLENTYKVALPMDTKDSVASQHATLTKWLCQHEGFLNE